MPSGDSRKEFICAVTSQFFGLLANDDAITRLYSVKELNNFLDDGGSELLSVKQEGKTVHLSNKVSFVHFYKWLIVYCLHNKVNIAR